MLNAGQLHHIGPNRIHVAIARQLAETGIFSVRIDQSGKGESAARSGQSRTEALVQDFDDVAAHLETLGVDRFVLFGLCSGADDALIIADERQQIAGLALLDGYVEHSRLRYADYAMRRVLSFDWVRHPPRNVISRLKRRFERKVEVDVRDWEAPDVMNRYYRDFMARGGKIMAIFTSGARYYTQHGQLARSIGAGDTLDEVYLKNATHTFAEHDNREKLYSLVSDWMNASFADN